MPLRSRRLKIITNKLYSVIVEVISRSTLSSMTKQVVSCISFKSIIVQPMEFYTLLYACYTFLYVFFQVSMVYNLPRSASVRAATPCVVFLLDRRDLNKVLKHYPAGRPLKHRNCCFCLILTPWETLYTLTRLRCLLWECLNTCIKFSKNIAGYNIVDSQADN